jgi:flagella basal body P-ring formation protein FlgA
MTWRFLHVPAFVAATGLVLLTGGAASGEETVLVPTRVIYPGETIALDALKEVTLRQGKVAPAAVAMADTPVEGKIARRTLLPGRYIAVNSLREAYLVDQGAAVQVMFVSGNLTISASAITLQAGSAGDLIKVRNIDSGKVFSGTVMADGSIRVGAS